MFNFSFYYSRSYQRSIIYLNSAGTTLKLKRIVRTNNDYARHYIVPDCHPHARTWSWTTHLTQTITAVQQFINAPSKAGIIFFSSATSAFNHISRSLATWVKPGEKILLTAFEHSSNDAPGVRLANEQQAQIEIIPTDQNGLVNLTWLASNLPTRTRIVTLATVNNNTGALQPIKKICQLIRKHNPDIIIVCDITQSVTTIKTDVQAGGVDCVVFAGHKMYGDFGVGVMWASPRLTILLKPFVLGGQVVATIHDQTYRLVETTHLLEAGTPNYYPIASLKIAIAWIRAITPCQISNHIQSLKQLFTRLGSSHLKSKIIFYNAQVKTGTTILINAKGYHAHDLAHGLHQHNVIVRAGDFCSKRFLRRYQVPAMVRISLQIYNTKSDIRRLVRYLRQASKLTPF